MRGFFIAGTSTEVGKTYVTCLLLRAFRERGIEAVGYKPVACGSREDAEHLLHAGAPGPSLDEVNPQMYRVPAAPMAAAMIENRPVDWGAMVEGAQRLSERYPLVLAEGVGGWKVPVDNGRTMADLAQELAWPVLLVVDNRLGALNHTLLTLESIAAHGLSCAGLLLNQPREERDAASISNAAILSEMTGDLEVMEIMCDQTELVLPEILLP